MSTQRNCISDSECGSGEYCNNRVCSRTFDGSPCELLGGCSGYSHDPFWHFGDILTCSSVDKRCHINGEGPISRPYACKTSNDCHSNDFCQNNGCVSRLLANLGCTSTDQVARNHICYNGRVVRPCTYDGHCEWGIEFCKAHHDSGKKYCFRKDEPANASTFSINDAGRNFSYSTVIHSYTPARSFLAWLIPVSIGGLVIVIVLCILILKRNQRKKAKARIAAAATSTPKIDVVQMPPPSASFQLPSPQPSQSSRYAAPRPHYSPPPPTSYTPLAYENPSAPPHPSHSARMLQHGPYDDQGFDLPPYQS